MNPLREKWSIATDLFGIPVGWAIDGANRTDGTRLGPVTAGQAETAQGLDKAELVDWDGRWKGVPARYPAVRLDVRLTPAEQGHVTTASERETAVCGQVRAWSPNACRLLSARQHFTRISRGSLVPTQACWAAVARSANSGQPSHTRARAYGMGTSGTHTRDALLSRVGSCSATTAITSPESPNDR